MMPALIVVAPVYEVILVIRALETVGQGYLGVAGTDRSLIEQIAPVPVGQIMQIETMGCIGDRAVHHGVVIAVEDIDLLTGDVVRVVDILRSYILLRHRLLFEADKPPRLVPLPQRPQWAIAQSGEVGAPQYI